MVKRHVFRSGGGDQQPEWSCVPRKWICGGTFTCSSAPRVPLHALLLGFIPPPLPSHWLHPPFLPFRLSSSTTVMPEVNEE